MNNLNHAAVKYQTVESLYQLITYHNVLANEFLIYPSVARPQPCGPSLYSGGTPNTYQHQTCPKRIQIPSNQPNTSCTVGLSSTEKKKKSEMIEISTLTIENPMKNLPNQ